MNEWGNYKGVKNKIMDIRLMKKLRKQTVHIYDEKGNARGTGFFVTDNLVATVSHCIVNDDGSVISPVLYVGEKAYNGFPKMPVDQIAFIFLPLPCRQEDRFSIGYCSGLDIGDWVDVYGYPQRQPKGHPLDDLEITGNFLEDGDETEPSIQCTVKNKEGALDRYEGMSGSPMVVGDCIVGIAATVDEGGGDTNALHFYDFSRPNIRNLFEAMGVNLKEVLITRRGKGENRNKATRMSLYRRAWWITESADRGIQLSDQYSIVLGTLLLAVTSNADIILASPWESGLAQYLQEETNKYEKEIPDWSGRRWIEYEDGAEPDWETLGEHTGVVVSVSAQDCTDVLLSGLLTGRRRLRGDVLVLWNIWSGQPGQSVRQAIHAAGQFAGNARKDLLTVFSSWQTEGRTEEKLPYTLLVQETAYGWLKKQTLDALSQESFLLGLKPEETDAAAWEAYQQYKGNPTEAWDGIVDGLCQICSDSVRALVSYCEGEGDLEDLLEAEPVVLKRWFASVKEEECEGILACLKNNRSLYWNAILINPYCTGYVLREWCEQRAFVQLLLEQDVTGGNDVSLKDEADTIRRQIRPI